MRIKLTLNYNGAGYIGWQSQKGGGSVQDCIEEALFKLTGETVSLTGSGRTDTGVHAISQVAHFDLNKNFDSARFAAGLNFYLPDSIRIQSAEEVSDMFNARKSAVRKTYIYVMYKSQFENALYVGRALKIAPETDIQLMREAAKHFIGQRDFFAFMSAGSNAKTTERTVFESEIIEQRDGLCNPPQIIYKVTANGFLYNMVRKITATLLQVGAHKISPSDIPNLIAARDRNKCKDLAKPHGLYLYSVEY